MDNYNEDKDLIEFDLPEGFSLPDQLSESGEFEALATIKMKDDGTACLKAVDGHLVKKMGMKKESRDSDNRGYAEAASDGMEEMM